MKINFLSLNAQGLKQQWKQTYLHKTCSDLQIHILAVQESHIALNNNKAWRKWSGEFLIIEGRTEKAAQGVAILVRLSLQPTNIQILFADNRLLIVKLLIFGIDFIIINLYNAINCRINDFYFTKVSQSLANLISIENVIFAGDFNRQRPLISKWSTIFESKYQIKDLAIATNSSNSPTHITARAATVIDYCWISHSLTPDASLAYLPNALSEHLALYASILININKQNKSSKCFFFPHPAMPMTTDFVNQIYTMTAPLLQRESITISDWELCKHQISKLVQNTNRVFNAQVSIQRKFLNAMFNQQNNYTSLSPAAIINLQRQYKELERINSLKLRFIIGKKLKGATNEITPLLKTPILHMLKKSNFISSLRVNGEVLLQQNMASAMSDILKSQLGALPPTGEPPATVNTYPPDQNHIQTSELLHKYFNQQSVRNSLNSVNKFAPAGPSTITTHFLIRFSYIFIPILIKLFKTWTTCTDSSLRFDSFTICFNKKSTSTNNHINSHQAITHQPIVPEPNDMRPINLENIEAKIFAKILYGIVLESFKDSLHPAQFCLAGRSIHNALNLLHDAHITFKNRKKDPPICLFVDIVKAFDSVDQQYLINKIHATTQNSLLCNAVGNYLSHKFTALKWRNFVYEDFRCQRGVSQGSPLSSLLFAIAMDDLLRLIDGSLPGIFLPSAGHNIRSIAYADDLVVFCNDRDEVDVVTDLIEEMGQMTGLHMNRKKTAALYINNFSPVTDTDKGILKNFLGLPMPLFTAESRLKLQDKILEKFESVCHTVSTIPLSLKAKVKIVNTICIPKLNYYIPHTNFPKIFTAKLNSIITKFLWGRKKPVISRRVMRYHYRYAGLSLIDIDLFIRSIRANALFGWSSFLDDFSQVDVDPTDTPPPWWKRTLFARGLKSWRSFQDDYPGIDTSAKIKYRDVRDATYVKNTASITAMALTDVTKIAEKLYLPHNIWDFTYKVTHLRLPTNHILHTVFRVNVEMTCPLCTSGVETTDHLLMECQEFQQVRTWLATDLSIDITPFTTTFDALCMHISRPTLLRPLIVVMFLMWKLRCFQVFSHTHIRKLVYIKQELTSLFKKDRQMAHAVDISELWPFKLPTPPKWSFLNK